MSISPILTQMQTLVQAVQSGQKEDVDYAEVTGLKQIVPAILTYLESQNPKAQSFYDVLWPTCKEKKIRASQPMQDQSIEAKYLAVLEFAKAFFSGIKEIDQPVIDRVMSPEGNIQERYNKLQSKLKMRLGTTYEDFPNFQSNEHSVLNREELEDRIPRFYHRWCKERNPHAHGLIIRTQRGAMGMFPQFIVSDAEERGGFGGIYIISSEPSANKSEPFVKFLPSFDLGRDYFMQFYDKYLAEDAGKIQFEQLKHQHLHVGSFQKILHFLDRVEFSNNESGKACKEFVDQLKTFLRNHSIFLTNRYHSFFPKEEAPQKDAFPDLKSPMKKTRSLDRRDLHECPEFDPVFDENLMRAITAEIAPQLNMWLDRLAHDHPELVVETRENIIDVVHALKEAAVPLTEMRKRLLNGLNHLHITTIPDLRNSSNQQILDYLEKNMPRPEGFYKAIYDVAYRENENNPKLTQHDFGEREAFTKFSWLVEALELLGEA